MLVVILPTMKQVPRFLILLFLLLCGLFFAFLGACARQGAPVGGPKDTQAPRVDTTKSTPNFSTQFDQRRIELVFDEWVVLSDVTTQIVVSPPLDKRPEVLLKGKKVIFQFDKSEVLRENTTYTLNFGTSVKDFRENNPAEDLRFVFSTGDFIDSLGFRGNVKDAFTGQPVENISVLLYENLADSAVRNERPYYFTRTDKTGNYRFENLRGGTYRVITLDDTDQNLRWVGATERIGFRDSLLVLNDSMRSFIPLTLFNSRPAFRLTGVQTRQYGRVKLGFSTATSGLEYEVLAPNGGTFIPEKTIDSLVIWYDLPQDTAWRLVVKRPLVQQKILEKDSLDLRFDTISVGKQAKEAFLKTQQQDFGDETAVTPTSNRSRGKTSGDTPPPARLRSVQTVTQIHSKKALLPFVWPISAVDTSRWELREDSTQVWDFGVMPDSSSPRRLYLENKWKQGKSYTLILYPGAIKSLWGQDNTDTLRRIFNVPTEKQLGNLLLTIPKLEPGSAYVLQLLNGVKTEDERIFVADAESQKFVFQYLPVAAYTVRLILDRNQNGRWDSGDYDALQQPELIYTQKLDPLRANWDLEAVFSTEPVNPKTRKQ